MLCVNYFDICRSASVNRRIFVVAVVVAYVHVCVMCLITFTPLPYFDLCLLCQNPFHNNP